MRNIALQMARTNSGLVKPNQNVLFDTKLYASGDIHYDAKTGVVTIAQAGQYIFNWWVSVPPSLGKEISFTLLTSQGDEANGSQPLPTGERIGFCVLEVQSVPMTVALRNTGDSPFSYASDVLAKAALLIVQDDFIDPVLPEAYGGLYSDANQEICIPQDGGVQTIELPLDMPNKSVTLSKNKIKIKRPGDYEVHYYMWMDGKGKDQKLSAGVRVGREKSFIADTMQTQVLVGETEFQQTAIASLQAGDELDLAVYSSGDVQAELTGRVNAFLILKKLLS